MMLPWWAMLLIQVLNALISNGAVAAATYVETHDENAAIIAGLGSLINHFRANPISLIKKS